MKDKNVGNFQHSALNKQSIIDSQKQVEPWYSSYDFKIKYSLPGCKFQYSFRNDLCQVFPDVFISYFHS